MKRSSSSNKVAVIGELNVDLVATGLSTLPKLGHEILATDFQVALGSASAIFACGMAKFGFAITFISKVGKDDFGKFCLDELQKSGVTTSRVRVEPDVKTGVTICLSTPEDRAMVTYLGAISQLKYADLPLSVLKGHRHLHLTSYFLQELLQASFPKILKQARRMGLTTSFDPNSDPSQKWEDDIWKVFAETDVLFMNEPEALQLTRRENIHQALKYLGKFTPCVVIKLGAKGAAAIKDGEITSAPGFKVEAIDTTGAGDSFDAGFIAGYVEGKTIDECLRIGNACGALSTLKAGGTAAQPDRAAVDKFLRARNKTK
jgi:sugar/nucleoside kinase (ribokinase family)